MEKDNCCSDDDANKCNAGSSSSALFFHSETVIAVTMLVNYTDAILGSDFLCPYARTLAY